MVEGQFDHLFEAHAARPADPYRIPSTKQPDAFQEGLNVVFSLRPRKSKMLKVNSFSGRAPQKGCHNTHIATPMVQTLAGASKPARVPGARGGGRV